MRTISHHMLRRTARAKARKMDATLPSDSVHNYVVEKAGRGPWRYRVVVRPRK